MSELKKGALSSVHLFSLSTRFMFKEDIPWLFLNVKKHIVFKQQFKICWILNSYCYKEILLFKYLLSNI